MFRGITAKMLRLLLGSKYFCPVCDRGVSHFTPLPDFYRINAEKHGYTLFGQSEMTSLETYSCPVCGASDRERLYAYWISEQIKNGSMNGVRRFIHFAPEQQLSTKLVKLGVFDYITADLNMKNVDHVVDMMDMPFPDESFDFFLCSHVLEHVEDDDQAIRELFRITRTGGKGILVAPIILGLDKTREDPSKVTESERWKHFGQNDHVRLYAHDDYVNKISEHGFSVSEIGIDRFGEKTFSRMGLKKTSVLYVVYKQ